MLFLLATINVWRGMGPASFTCRIALMHHGPWSMACTCLFVGLVCFACLFEQAQWDSAACSRELWLAHVCRTTEHRIEPQNHTLACTFCHIPMPMYDLCDCYFQFHSKEFPHRTWAYLGYMHWNWWFRMISPRDLIKFQQLTGNKHVHPALTVRLSCHVPVDFHGTWFGHNPAQPNMSVLSACKAIMDCKHSHWRYCQRMLIGALRIGTFAPS